MSANAHSLGDVIDYLRGITFKPEEKVDPRADDAVVCMRTKNVQEALDETDLIAVPSSLVKRPELFLREGDILLSSANSWNLVGKVCRVPRLSYRATAGGFISVVRPRSNVDARYLYRWLACSDVQERIRGCARQTTNISNLSVPQFEQLKIPVPPLPDQQRIADILDKADAVRRKRREIISIADELVQSTFLEIVGDPATNPRGWRTGTIGDLLTLKSGDFLPAKRMDSAGPHAVYGGNGINGRHSTYMFEEPVLTIGRVGVYCGVVHRTEPRSWVTDNALYVASHAPDLDGTYLEYALRLANLNQYSSQAAQPLISGGRLAPVRLLVPPMHAQVRFARAAEVHSSLLGRARQALSSSTALFDALVARAFSSSLGGAC